MATGDERGVETPIDDHTGSEPQMSSDDLASSQRDVFDGDTTCPQTNGQVVVTGLGEGGSRTALVTLDTLYRCGLLDLQERDVGDRTLTTSDGRPVRIGILDTDQFVSEELTAAVSSRQFADHLLENTVAPFEGSGGNPDRVQRWFDSNDWLDQWLVKQHSTDATGRIGGTLVHLALLGGTGNGSVRQLCADIQQGRYLDAADDGRGPVIAVAVAPAFRNGDRPRHRLPDEPGAPRTAFVENVIPGLDHLATHVDSGTLNSAVLVSNGLLNLQSHALAEPLSYEELKRIISPIRRALDWGEFRQYFQKNRPMREATKLRRANDSLRKSLLPLYLGLLRPPEISVRAGWSRADAMDFKGLFDYGIFAPGRCFLSERDDIVTLYESAKSSDVDFDTALNGAAGYSAWTSGAAFSTLSVQRVTVFTFNKRGDLAQASEHGVRRTVAGEFDIAPHDVTVATIEGFTDESFPGGEAPEIAVWTYPSVADPVAPYAQHLSPDEREYLANEHDLTVR
ncbi:hypothetical protein [Haloarcula sediminis]|uniref:hypothetical protein n=1 Tax=Haloarcula sediminis TaxID=3111777 RepID=UPI002D77DA92|nr:hypothetical protein [Haloarcula sp. CK38]